MKKILIVFLVISIIAISLGFFYKKTLPQTSLPITSFQECIDAGNPVMESYPRQCSASGKTFVEDIGNALEKGGLIVLENPRPNDKVLNPLTLNGTARGYWFFEASFPVVLYDEEGNELASGIATAQGEWMTEEFVPFTASLSFTKPVSKTGKLVLKKDNPSGLPENDDELVVPVRFN